ncbi:MAG: RNA-binding protein [Rothia sp.]|uniref:RNA-binding protein n=1 Tax=Rothia sp. (in: high G+C Gram-positive bacteria) TaxID=1885016 RepID=UPI001CABF886|nr:RNA-binding protein [Rothia sp. (in: high G+C Gram-positive bacteria)]MBF1680879.1 RNA-binding protein [Rothia sp. (in: high G+C Gram-positive bacteria)]
MLKYPLDLDAWQAWQRRQKKLKWAKYKLNTLLDSARSRTVVEEPVRGLLYTRGTKPQVLIVMDSFSPTNRNAILEPLKHLDAVDVALWVPEDASEYLDGQYASERYSRKDWSEQKISGDELISLLPDVRIVLSAAQFLGRGAVAYEFSRAIGAEYWMVQHGLLVPQAPPLPVGCTLLAFSKADAEFWASGRRDVTTHAVGSQLLYLAAQKAAGTEAQKQNDLEPIFLGQMHGAELPRASFAYASHSFLKKFGGVYRPHPSEKDKLSVLTHQLWEKEGIRIDRSGTPLNEVPNPVVSIFSTGVLEAAIRGIPAWVYHPAPPAWLVEFWDRYGMNQWGQEPTPAPIQPDKEPARRIAELMIETLEA